MAFVSCEKFNTALTDKMLGKDIVLDNGKLKVVGGNDDGVSVDDIKSMLGEDIKLGDDGKLTVSDDLIPEIETDTVEFVDANDEHIATITVLAEQGGNQGSNQGDKGKKQNKKQGKTEQGKTEQSETEQSETDQNVTEQDNED